MKIAVIGAAGRMGVAVIQETLKNSIFQLSAGYATLPTNEANDLGEIANLRPIGIKASTDLSATIETAEIIIDFSAPELSLQAMNIAAAQQKIFVSGTTGFNDAEFNQIEQYAQQIPILWSANMSIGVNLLHKLVTLTAQQLDSDFATEILEMHHQYKKDAPSGTALALGKTLAAAKNIDFNSSAKLSREGICGERQKDEIGFATLRGGSVVGEHSVIFAAENEIIELTHKAVNRNIFAHGALQAAKWLYSNNKSAGLYSIADLLN